MNTRFLTHDELKALTAFTTSSKQREWLARNAWTFFVGGDGRPRVAFEHYEVKMGFRAGPPAAQAARLFSINADALRAAAR